MKYQESTRVAVDKTFSYCVTNKVNFLKLEHFAFFLMETKEIKKIFKSLNIDSDSLKKELSTFYFLPYRLSY